MIRAPGTRFLVFAVLAVALTVGIGRAISGAEHAGGYELTARFDDVTGMRPGDHVRVAGVPVGSVRGLGVVDGRAEVTFTVRDDVALPPDSTAVAGYVDLLGNRQIDLLPGTADGTLTAGDQVARTVSRADAGALAADLGPLTRSLDPAQFNALLASVSELIERNEDDLTTLVTDGRLLLETVASRGDTIDRLLTDVTLVGRTFVDREAELRSLVTDLVALAEAFGGTEQVLATTLDDAAGAVLGLTDLLDTHEADLVAMLADITTVLGQAQRNVDQLVSGLRLLPRALDALYSVVRHGDHIRVDATCFGPHEPPCPTFRQGGPFTDGEDLTSFLQTLIAGLEAYVQP